MKSILSLLIFMLPFYPFCQNGATEGNLFFPEKKEIRQEVYLIGGTGDEEFHRSPLPYYLNKQLAKSNDNTTVLLLGNIISDGLPLHKKNRKRTTLTNFFTIEKMLENFEGEIIFLPGYEDWGDGGYYGRSVLERQNTFLKEGLKNKNKKFPCHQCPGPKVIKLAKGIVIIAIDTQWWLQPDGRNDGTEECRINNEEDFLIELQSLLEEHDEDNVIVAGHHALFTAGEHGGFFPAKKHLFPLTQFNDNLWMPLPVIGSVYPLYRRGIGTKQDHANVRYAYMRDQLNSIIELYPNIIYAGGNEENLQYFHDDVLRQHYIVSGAASGAAYVSPKSGARFAASRIGFFKINYFKDGSVWLEAWAFSNKKEKEAQVIFKTEIKKAERKDFKLIPGLMPNDSTILAADKRYAGKGMLGQKLIGENYRKEWLTPITVPVIDFGKEEFTPIKMGGGVQTKSLRVERPDGSQFVLRSVQKEVVKKLPRFLRNTFVRDWLQDGISASHPYAGLVLPTLSEAVGINHAIPKLGYVPSSNELGIFNEDFAGTLVTWEERPKGDMSERPNFGFAEDIESTPDVLQKTRKSLKNRVDEKELIKNRIFDMLIGDIDRHDDQFRWAVHQQGDEGDIYRPIPRDRDWAFVVADGLLLKVAGQKWAFREAQGYGENIRDMAGFALHGKYIDRTFITESTRDVWVKEAEEMQKKLTDEVIEKAIKEWPKPIFDLHGDTIISLLKVRRGKLPMWAAELYEINSKQVDVLGSNKRELFEVNRLNDTVTNVKIYGLDKKGEKKGLFYQRDFLLNETKEISLYGFENDDIFKFNGNTNKAILVRAIGGNGKDVFMDSSFVKKGNKKTWIYDTKKNTEIIEGAETKDLTSKNELVNFYDRFEHKYPRPLPLVVLGFNRDDIFYIGGGYSIKTFGFRKKPYATRHAAKFYYSFSKAFALTYKGDYRKIWGPLNLDVTTYFFGPNYKSQYFGVGNNTVLLNPENLDYHSADYDELWLSPEFYFDTRYQNHKISFGPLYQLIDVKEEGKDNFVNSPAAGLLPEAFSFSDYYGGQIGYTFKNVDNDDAPQHGMKWDNKMVFQKGIKHPENRFVRYNSKLSLYVPLNRFKSVLALRTGASSLNGEYEFYHNNFIGGQKTLLDDVNLSGYQRNRFAGKTTFYQNIEYRYKLFEEVKVILPFDIGLVGNYDFGRVWATGESSDTWHHGYGLGVTGTVASYPVFMVNYTWSREDHLFLLSTKFRF